jgi:hypothetical protein
LGDAKVPEPEFWFCQLCIGLAPSSRLSSFVGRLAFWMIVSHGFSPFTWMPAASAGVFSSRPMSGLANSSFGAVTSSWESPRDPPVYFRRARGLMPNVRLVRAIRRSSYHYHRLFLLQRLEGFRRYLILPAHDLYDLAPDHVCHPFQSLHFLD